MPQLTYELIAPIIIDQSASGSSVRVTFQCPVSGTQVQSSATMRKGTVSQMKDRASRTLWWSVKSSLARSVRSALGHGLAGRMASDVVYGMGGSGMSGGGSGYTAGEQQAAVLEAFKRVQGQFSWDDHNRRFVSSKVLADLLTDFNKLLSSVHITQKWDQGVLARMLAEIACADGQVSDGERQFFQAFAESSAKPIDQLIQSPKLSRAELSETSPKIREAMLAMAYALAFADEELDTNEQNRLKEYADGLGISPRRAEELGGYAKAHIVDSLFEVIYLDGYADPSERAHVQRMANTLGLDAEAVERIDIRCRKRKGII